MSTSKYFDRICAGVIVIALVITVLFMNGQALGIGLVTDADSEAHSDSVYFTENDQVSDWSTDGATVITLEGSTASVKGTNAYVYDQDVVITNSGRYVISGMLDDGSVIVDANDNSKVWILFQGVDISCSDHACLRVEEADKVFLTLADGTENTLTSGEELCEEALEDGAYGTIFTHDDLTINGSGSLKIHAGYKHGIKANDDLVITGGTITIDAPADAVHVNDSFRLKDADLNLTAGDDGILVENEDGYFYMESGSAAVDAQGDAIHSNADLIFAGGTLRLDAGDDAIHADGSIEISDGTIQINSCYEGIEALTIDVSGGDITVCSTDDGFNANGGSDSFADGMMPGGFGSGQMPQDADRPAEGMTEESVQEETDEETSEEETWIRISGGTITILNENGNDSDGLDSNGSIYITGGTIRISMSDNGMNCALDAGTESGGMIQISGGTLIACGSSSMAEGCDSSSEQCSVLYTLASGAEDSTVLSLEDEEGTSLISWEVPYGFSSALISCPEMETGKTYTIVSGETEETIELTEIAATAGAASSRGMMHGGGMAQDDMPSGMQWNDTQGAVLDGASVPDMADSTEASGDMAQKDMQYGMPDGASVPDGAGVPDVTDSTEASGDTIQEGLQPEFGNRPQMPEGGTDLPAMGQNHRMGGGQQASFAEGEMNAQSAAEGLSAASAEAVQDQEDTTDSTFFSYDRSVYIELVVSVVVLFLGLIIAKRYRK